LHADWLFSDNIKAQLPTYFDLNQTGSWPVLSVAQERRTTKGRVIRATFNARQRQDVEDIN
jgi:hypothetical protein